MEPTGSPLNFCRTCKRDFASLKAFDRHRVGTHAFSFNEGWALVPPREDGRRCMGADEYVDAGLEVNEKGRWCVAADVEKLRAYWAQAA